VGSGRFIGSPRRNDLPAWWSHDRNRRAASSLDSSATIDSGRRDGIWIASAVLLSEAVRFSILFLFVSVAHGEDRHGSSARPRRTERSRGSGHPRRMGRGRGCAMAIRFPVASSTRGAAFTAGAVGCIFRVRTARRAWIARTRTRFGCRSARVELPSPSNVSIFPTGVGRRGFSAKRARREHCTHYDTSGSGPCSLGAIVHLGRSQSRSGCFPTFCYE